MEGQICCGKPMQLSFESGKRWEQCADCGCVCVNGVPSVPPKGADAVELRRLGFHAEADEFKKAAAAKAAAAKAKK